MGPAGRLLDVRGYVWPKIRPAVVYGRHVRGFPTPLPATAGTLAVWGGAGSDGRYIGHLRWSRIRWPLRWLFAVELDPTTVTLAVCGGARLGVGPVGRLLDVRGYVWPKIRPAVVYSRHVRGFPTPLRGTAGTLAVWGGAGSDGRYVGHLRWSQIWRPLRWPFVLQLDPVAGTLAIFG